MKGIKVAFVVMSAGISFFSQGERQLSGSLAEGLGVEHAVNKAEAAEQLFLYLVDYFRGRIESSVKETLRRNKPNSAKNCVS